VKETERAVWFGFALPSVTKETERALKTLGDMIERGEKREKSSHALDVKRRGNLRFTAATSRI